MRQFFDMKIVYPAVGAGLASFASAYIVPTYSTGIFSAAIIAAAGALLGGFIYDFTIGRQE